MKLNPFKKKKPKEPPAPPGPPAPPPGGGDVPREEVKSLSSQGVPEPDIIRTLRREGYTTTEIDQAMKEALRDRVSGGEQTPPPPPRERPPRPERREPLPPDEGLPEREDIPRNLAYPGSDAMDLNLGRPPAETQRPRPSEPEFPEIPKGRDFGKYPEKPAPPGKPRTRGGVDKREIEELAEVIVDEKMRAMDGRFRSLESKFTQLSNRIEALSHDLNRMRSEKSGEVKGIEKKIDDYAGSINQVNSKIESMEKAFRDSMSPMLDSVRSLSDLVKTMKSKKE